MLADTGTHNTRLADLDGNGHLDVVGKNFDGPKQVEIWYAVPTETPSTSTTGLSLEGFAYVEVDAERELFNGSIAFFGLGFGDGDHLTAGWERVGLADEVGTDVDSMLLTDIDNDEFGDISATSLPDVWWIEIGDDGKGADGSWRMCQRPVVRNGQGYRLGDLDGDQRNEIMLSGGSSEPEVWYVDVPDDPTAETCPPSR